MTVSSAAASVFGAGLPTLAYDDEETPQPDRQGLHPHARCSDCTTPRPR